MTSPVPLLKNMQTLFPYGWGHYLAGGLLIGAGVSLMFLLLGRIVGMSTFFSSTWSYVSRLPYFQQSLLLQTRLWRLVCAIGLVLGAALWWWMAGPDEAAHTQLSPARLLIGGLLVGYGARLANGCTSGHGICGLASLSRPSLAAVLIFMAVAIITARVFAFVTGGAA